MSKKKIKYPNIVRGGTAIPLGNNNYLIAGKSHEQGGVDVGKDLEVEGGEVMHMGDKDVTVYSAMPILNGISPAEAIIQGGDPKQVFKAQEEYKRINKLNDDGTKKAQTGIRKRLSFDEWYNTIPKEINDTTNYNLRRAYELLNDKTLEDWKNGKSHLPSVIELPNGNYEFLKSKNHPTYKKEIDWYNSEEAKDFRNNYLLDDSTEYPIYRKKAKYSRKKFDIGGDEDNKNELAKLVAETVIDFTPVVGDIKGITYDPYIAYKEGGLKAGLGDLGLGMIGLVPFIGDAAKTAIKSSKLVKAVNKGIGTALDKNRNFIFKVADKIAPNWKYKQLTASDDLVSKVNAVLPQSEIAKQEIKKHYIAKDLDTKHDVPYEEYRKHIDDVTIKPATRWEDMINNLGATNSSTGRATARGKFGNDEIILYSKGLDGNINPLELFTHEYDHGAQAALKEATINNIKQGNARLTRQPINENNTIIRLVNDLSEVEDDWYRSINEINAEIQRFRVKNGLVLGSDYNIWNPDIQVKANEFISKRFGISENEAARLMSEIGIQGYRYGGKTRKIARMGAIINKNDMKNNYQVNESGKPKVRYIPSTGEKTQMRCGGRKKANLGTHNAIEIEPAIIRANVSKRIEPIDSSKFNKFATQSTITGKPKIKYTNTSINDEFVKQQNRQTNWKSFKDNGYLSDSIGLLSNLTSGLIGYGVNNDMLKKMKAPKEPIAYTPQKLKTRININPQLDRMRETVAAYEQNVGRNTTSSKVAQSRIQNARYSNMLDTNSLYGAKENQETELINADIANRQSAMFKNVDAYNNYLNRKNEFENSILDKRSENAIGLLNTINAGFQDSLSRIENRQALKRNARVQLAANPHIPIELFTDIFTPKEIKQYRFTNPLPKVEQ